VRIRFSAGDAEYLGDVNLNRIEAIARSQNGITDWTATAVDSR